METFQRRSDRKPVPNRRYFGETFFTSGLGNVGSGTSTGRDTSESTKAGGVGRQDHPFPIVEEKDKTEESADVSVTSGQTGLSPNAEKVNESTVKGVETQGAGISPIGLNNSNSAGANLEGMESVVSPIGLLSTCKTIRRKFRVLGYRPLLPDVLEVSENDSEVQFKVKAKSKVTIPTSPVVRQKSCRKKCVPARLLD